MHLSDITIRTDIRPGDLGYVMHRHGKLYSQEYDYGVAFETYVGSGLHEFYRNYDPGTDRAWIGEYAGEIISFILLMHRENHTAQLRYFYIEPPFRGMGLGCKLMELFVEFLKEKDYKFAYLWTTKELIRAAALYNKFGFVLTEEKPTSNFGKPVIEQRYDLKLI